MNARRDPEDTVKRDTYASNYVCVKYREKNSDTHKNVAVFVWQLRQGSINNSYNTFRSNVEVGVDTDNSFVVNYRESF